MQDQILEAQIERAYQYFLQYPTKEVWQELAFLIGCRSEEQIEKMEREIYS